MTVDSGDDRQGRGYEHEQAHVESTNNYLQLQAGEQRQVSAKHASLFLKTALRMGVQAWTGIAVSIF